jgi:hypothetical protein
MMSPQLKSLFLIVTSIVHAETLGGVFDLTARQLAGSKLYPKGETKGLSSAVSKLYKP